MSVTQYIGARYVPLFDGEWDNTKVYEPLTIVQYQGNSYTSVQAVPQGIDINNTNYWAATGNYNAQVEAYRREVMTFDGRIDQNADRIAQLDEDLDAEIEARQNAIAAEVEARNAAIGVETDARTLADNVLRADIQTKAPIKNYIGVIGDSFSTWSNYDYWPQILSDRTQYNIINKAVNGAGFTTGSKTFQTQLQELIADENFDKVAHIFVYGGVNDWNDAHASIDLMNSTLTNFYNVYYSIPKANRPQLHLCFGNIGYANQDQYNGYYPWYFTIVQNLIQHGRPGVVEHVPYWHFCTGEQFNADNLHPNDLGQKTIAAFMLQILNGSYTGVHRVKYFDALNYNGSPANGRCTLTFDNGRVGFGLRTSAYTPITPASNTFYDFGDVTGGRAQWSLMIGTDLGLYPNIWQTSAPIIMAIDAANNGIGILRAIFNCSNKHLFFQIFGSAAGFDPNISIPNDLQLSLSSNPNCF